MSVNGEFTLTVTDHLGSSGTNREADGTTTVQKYTPFGALRTSADNLLLSDWTFTGQTDDPGTGLIDYNARHYDPQLGRFIMANTVLDGLNRYTYVHNNPLNATDPTGNFCFVSGPRQGECVEQGESVYPEFTASRTRQIDAATGGWGADHPDCEGIVIEVDALMNDSWSGTWLPGSEWYEGCNTSIAETGADYCSPEARQTAGEFALAWGNSMRPAAVAARGAIRGWRARRAGSSADDAAVSLADDVIRSADDILAPAGTRIGTAGSRESIRVVSCGLRRRAGVVVSERAPLSGPAAMRVEETYDYVQPTE